MYIYYNILYMNLFFLLLWESYIESILKLGPYPWEERKIILPTCLS